MILKDYGFLSFAKNMSKIIGKDRSKNLSGKKSQKLVDHAEQPPADAFKNVSKRAIEKRAEVIGDLIGNKIADKITRVSKASSKNNPERSEEEILTEIFIPSELKRKSHEWSKIKARKALIIEDTKSLDDLKWM